MCEVERLPFGLPERVPVFGRLLNKAQDIYSRGKDLSPSLKNLAQRIEVGIVTPIYARVEAPLHVADRLACNGVDRVASTYQAGSDRVHAVTHVLNETTTSLTTQTGALLGNVTNVASNAVSEVRTKTVQVVSNTQASLVSAKNLLNQRAKDTLLTVENRVTAITNPVLTIVEDNFDLFLHIEESESAPSQTPVTVEQLVEGSSHGNDGELGYATRRTLARVSSFSVRLRGNFNTRVQRRLGQLRVVREDVSDRLSVLRNAVGTKYTSLCEAEARLFTRLRETSVRTTTSALALVPAPIAQPISRVPGFCTATFDSARQTFDILVHSDYVAYVTSLIRSALPVAAIQVVQNGSSYLLTITPSFLVSRLNLDGTCAGVELVEVDQFAPKGAAVTSPSSSSECSCDEEGCDE